MSKQKEDKEQHFQQILSSIEQFIDKKLSRDEVLQQICKCLTDNIDDYDWVGFYLVDPLKPKELVLGPFVGQKTDHDRIPFGKGICGQAAEQEKTFIVQDVTQESNYLSCNIAVKSEIVVSMFKKGKVIGQLDIDSHTLASFDEIDQKNLEIICEMTARLF